SARRRRWRVGQTSSRSLAFHAAMHFLQAFEQSVPVVFGCVPAAAEPQHPTCFVRRITHRSDDMGWLLLAAGTRRAGGYSESQLVELYNPALLGVCFGHQRGHGVPQTFLSGANDL